jgi:hypothetical protein
MFGFGFKSKVKKVLLKEFNYVLKSIEEVEPESLGGQTEEKTVKNFRKKFDYEIRKIQDDSLNSVIEETKNNYGNEYDAAIMFLIVQMNSLNIGSDGASNFVSENASNIRRIIPLSSHSEGEISSMFAEIQNKHENKDEETIVKQKNEFVEVFQDWIANNEKETEQN